MFCVNLLPLRTAYSIECEGCGAPETIDKKAGRETAKKEFREEVARQNMRQLFKYFVLLLIAAAIVLPLELIRVPSPDPQMFKDLVSEDGVYNILDRDGAIAATVSVQGGEKTLLFYDDVSLLAGEPGASGFTLHRYYREAAGTDGTVTLERIPDDAGVLLDTYQTEVRTYYYDSAADAAVYSSGITDLRTIEYGRDRVTYPFTHHLSETVAENYTVVLYHTDNEHILATFTPALTDGAQQLSALLIRRFADGRASTETAYYLEADATDQAVQAGITPESTADAIKDFIAQNALTPSWSGEYSYYENTRAVLGQTLYQPDASGVMQPIAISYQITEKNGYFIQSIAAAE